MTRVLHIADPARSGWPALAMLADTCRLRTGQAEHRVVVIGGAPAESRASALGVPTAERIPAPMTRPALAAPALRRVIRARRGTDLLVAWSAEAAVLARLASPATPFAAVLTLPPPSMEGRPVNVVIARCLRDSSVLVFSSPFLRDGWVARFTLLGCPTVVVPPAPNIEGATIGDRVRIRSDWGVAPETRVIMPLGEPESAINARRIVFLAGVLEAAGHPAVVVLPAGASQLERALRFANRTTPRIRAIVEDRTPHMLLPSCDAVIWLPHREGHGIRSESPYTEPCGCVSLAWASACGVPIVALDHPAVHAVVNEGPRVRFITQPSRIAVVQALLDLFEIAPGHPPPFRRAGAAEALEACLVESVRRMRRTRTGLTFEPVPSRQQPTET